MEKENITTDTISPGHQSVRRRFLEKIIGGLSGIGFLSILYPILRYIEPPPEVEGNNRIEINIEDLPEGAAKTILFRGRPALVVNGPDGFVAYSAVCTHLGCVVKWVKDAREFRCPCHGGRFNARGEKAGGPVTGPLTPIKLTVRDDKVLVGV